MTCYPWYWKCFSKFGQSLETIMICKSPNVTRWMFKMHIVPLWPSFWTDITNIQTWPRYKIKSWFSYWFLSSLDFIFLGLVYYSHTATRLVIWQFFQLWWWRKTPCAPPDIIHTRAGTWVEPPTYHKPAGWLPHMKDFTSGLTGNRTHSGEGQVIRSQRL